MCPPDYVGSRNTHDTGIYKLHLHLHIHPYHTQGARISQKQDEYKALQSLPAYNQNGFLSTEALGHMMYLMHSELLHCI